MHESSINALNFTASERFCISVSHHTLLTQHMREKPSFPLGDLQINVWTTISYRITWALLRNIFQILFEGLKLSSISRTPILKPNLYYYHIFNYFMQHGAKVNRDMLSLKTTQMAWYIAGFKLRFSVNHSLNIKHWHSGDSNHHLYGMFLIKDTWNNMR